MKVRRIAACALTVLLLLSGALRAESAADAVRRHVGYLSSVKLEGRLTGTPGERLAADYVAHELKRIGAVPLAGEANLLQPFEFTAGTEDAGSVIELRPASGRDSRRFKGVENVRALSFSDSAAVSGQVVFAGYGLTVPGTGDLAYDSYAGLDVKDKIVLVLRYSPEDVAEETRTSLARYAGLRYKALRARELGARALLVLTGPRSPNAGETIPLSFDAALSGSGIAAASIGRDVAEAIFQQGGQRRSLEEIQRRLDSGDPHFVGFALGDLTVALDVRVRRERRTGHNVLAQLPRSSAVPDAAAARTRYVVLGAHYDHLGRGTHGNSLARKHEAGRIHPGADDNASGVAAVLAAAAEIAAAPHDRPILLAFWSGEELGLLGSSHFIKAETLPRKDLAAYLNFDMVGRMRDNRLDLQGVGSSSVWKSLIEQTNVPIGFDIRTQEDPFLPTDSTAFYQAGIPVLSFFTGSHEDYHRPTDVARSVDYDGLLRISRFAALLARKVADLPAEPDYLEVERKSPASGDRDSVRGYTGTIPDYSTEVEGLRLAGVVGGGPADRAGLREGDVIVEFAGRKIANIYDYTYALDAVKINQPVTVIFLRNGERREVSVVPTSRP